MKIEKITVGRRVWFTSAASKGDERRGQVVAIHQTKTGPFVEIEPKDGTKNVKTRPALVLR